MCERLLTLPIFPVYGIRTAEKKQIKRNGFTERIPSILDDTYYHFITAGKIVINNLSIAKPEFIIPLKARAWLDLTDRRKQSVNVDSRDIKNHKNDVFRLFSHLFTALLIDSLSC